MSEATTIKCEDAIRLLAAYIDGELAAADQAAVHQHLDHCRSCYSRAEFETRLKLQVSMLGVHLERPGLEDRIRNLLHTFRSDEQGA